MHTATPLASPLHDQDSWVLLRALTLFRLLSCLFFLSAPFLPFTQSFFAPADPPTLLLISTLYLLTGLVMAGLYWRQQPLLSTQVNLQIYADIVFITLLMHQLGGVSSGVGILLCASLSATALLRQALSCYFFAAVATLSVLGQTAFEQLYSLHRTPDYTQATVLCIALFAVSALSARLNQHRSTSTAVIADQQQRLTGLQSLSSEILRQFDHGLLAISANGYIAHSNPTALRLLGNPPQHKPLQLADTAPALARFLASGERSGSVQHQQTELYVTAKHIEDNIQLLTLVEQSQRDAEAQQMKLATLGQWTASVAHEIRNPLSAITQAAQLLQENTDDASMERRLADMVQRNSQRIDLIVTDILNLARPSRELNDTPLKPWLEGLAAELRSVHPLTAERLRVTGDGSLHEHIDPNKLRHVIENLCKNSLLHGGRDNISIHIEVLEQHSNTIIRLSDNGQGVSPQLRSRLFDPFCSSASRGTGLGLFIAREICEQHHIDLQLCQNNSGAVFELRFQRPAQTLQQAA